MRIVLDLQGAQTESRFRGIGSYVSEFAQAVVRNRGDHEVIIALSGLFPETIEPLRATFDGLLPQSKIRVWDAPGPVSEAAGANHGRRGIAELIRESFLLGLQPDIVHVCSFFEGFADDAVTSLGRLAPSTIVSATLYDLIPLVNPRHYLDANPRFAAYYRRKITDLNQADLLLAISESSRREGLEQLKLQTDRIVSVGTGLSPSFRGKRASAEVSGNVLLRCSITRPYLLYAGGADERKNLARLVAAFARLPVEQRGQLQLVMVGRMPEAVVSELYRQAERLGLQGGDLLFTGYIDEADLIALYAQCELFVFPSWHEGFGLPALEAMACGAPVIAANTSSLPEVIGRTDALFDPFDVGSISAKISQILSDPNLRAELQEHGLQQAERFSWDRTARLAIAAWEQLPKPAHVALAGPDRLIESVRPLLREPGAPSPESVSACISRNRLAGTQRQLLLDVSELCQRDAATGVQRVVRSYLHHLLESPPKGWVVEPVYASLSHRYRYARKFGARFRGIPFDVDLDLPVRWQRGDVFFGLDMQHHVQIAHQEFYQRLKADGVSVQFLVHDLLPIQLPSCFKDSDARELHEAWLALVARTDGAVCVSRATADALRNWLAEAGTPAKGDFNISWVHNGTDTQTRPAPLQDQAGLAEVFVQLARRPTFLSVSTLEPRKCQQQILEAIELTWAAGVDVNLILVGGQGWRVEELTQRLSTHPENGRRLFWLRGISDADLAQIYSASTCLVAASLDEGFGLPLIEAAQHELPILARDIPVFREVAGKHAAYFRGESAESLAGAIGSWLETWRTSSHPTSAGMPFSTWVQSAERLKSILLGPSYPGRQLMVDISELVRRDARTGIQRVVRNVLQELLANPPAGYKIEPVYADLAQDYRYARAYTARLLGAPELAIEDDLVEYTAGDAFLGLDFQLQIVAARVDTLRDMRRRGVQVSFVVYDLIPLRLPECFVPGTADGFLRWLDVVTEVADTAVCISRTVACQLDEWVCKNGLVRTRRMAIKWFYLGADPLASIPIATQPRVFTDLADVPVFLMVGTVEPRKGHAVVLDAFELLWSHGIAARLVIVGKQGWLVDKLAQRIETHPAAGNTLHWYRQVDDAELEALYASASCLIAASYEEGFGLPLIEAALREVPVIARDLPVFREVAEDGAYYFPAADDGSLYDHLIKWLTLRERGEIPNPKQIRVNTWAESTDSLKAQLSLKEIY